MPSGDKNGHRFKCVVRRDGEQVTTCEFQKAKGPVRFRGHTCRARRAGSAHRLAREAGLPHGGCQLLSREVHLEESWEWARADTFLRRVRRAPPPTPISSLPGRALPSAPPGRPKGTCPHPCPWPPPHPSRAHQNTRLPDEGEQAAQRPLPAQELAGAGCPATAPAPPAARSPGRPPRPRPPPPAGCQACRRPFLRGRGPPARPGSPGAAAAAPAGAAGAGAPRSAGSGGAGLATSAARAGTGLARAPRCRADRAAGPSRGARTAGRRRLRPQDVSVGRGGAPPGGSGRGRAGAGPGGAGRRPGGSGGAQAGPPERDPRSLPVPPSARLSKRESPGHRRKQLAVLTFSGRGLRSPILQP